MPISDHVAILTFSSLAVAVPNKIKAGNPLEYFGVLAYPPEAAADLKQIAVDAATPTFGGLHADVQIGIERNSARKKPLPGIPGNWFIVRTVSRFAPEVYSARGELLAQTLPEGLSAIKQAFFAGKKVRANINGFPWTHQTGGRGISFNLSGVMDAGQGGERMAVGNNNDSGSAFAKHANPNAASPSTVSQSPGTQQGDPFGAAAAQSQATGSGTAQGNPFGGAGAAGGDPFAQATGGGAADPFA